MRSRVYETVRRPSVRPFFCPSTMCPQQQTRCCCGLSGQEISIDCWSSGVRRANAGSATLLAYVGIAEHRPVVQNCRPLIGLHAVLLSSGLHLVLQAYYQQTNRTELTRTSRPSYTTRSLVTRVSVTARRQGGALGANAPPPQKKMRGGHLL